MTNLVMMTDFESLCEQVKLADMPYRKHRLIVGYKGYFHASETGKLISLIDDCTTKALCLNHIVRVRLHYYTVWYMAIPVTLIQRMPACTCSEAVAVIKAFKMIRDRVDALQTISKLV
ncbi:uncharacterized protein LOC117107663 isoform X1 [Anneissia japonica]|uniref:uncharacterized protein LOC117107663 isoform X1 n=1 Tax=Anneissia japonica TaxID=1529436 RepID=UPI001425A6FA|nr:uncharacterized protein LOC117107663 isoform X1 [Anneissia japonica]